MYPQYFSLKTKDREYCFEPLLGDEYFLAVYDKKKELATEKIKMGLEEAGTAMMFIQKDTGKKFVVKTIK